MLICFIKSNKGAIQIFNTSMIPQNNNSHSEHENGHSSDKDIEKDHLANPDAIKEQEPNISHHNDKNSSDLFHSIKQKLQAKPKEEVSSLLSPPADSKNSMFKQFAEIKMEDVPQREYVCKSKRKIKPGKPIERHGLEQTAQLMDAGSTQCHILLQKKGRKSFAGQTSGSIDPSCLWAFHDLFYSSVDRNYFRDEPLRRLLNDIGMSSQQKTYQEHRMIRQALPAPKTFNSDFLFGELDKLAQCRAQVRSIPRQVSLRLTQKGRDWELAVGKEVIALHPVCGHLHTGSILAIYKENQYMVKFQRLELGTQKVVDVFMTPRQMSTHQRVVIQNVDYDVMALAIKLLQYKSDLLALLKEFNNKAQIISKTEGTFNNTFFQEYGWIGSTINILSLGIRHVIAKFRIRGLTGANQQRVGKNFASILINPLRPIERILNKSSQNSDRFAREQIESLINSHKDSRTDQVTKQLFSKYGAGLKSSELQGTQKQEMEKILKNMIGLLVNLRYESRHFSLDDNKYLNELMSAIDTRYPEHFNEIYETLHSITGKVGEEVKQS